VVLAALAILTALGAPRLGALVRALDHDADVQTLVLALAVARRSAILGRHEVLLCPRPGPGTPPDEPCGRNWRAGVRVLRPDGSVLWRSGTLEGSASVRWRGFGSPTRLRWTVLGILRRQAGAFHLCARAPGREARIVLSAVGRVRVERRHPGGPPLRNGRGRELACP
jgi:Tfp pilus assembly protein FimT